MAYFTRLLFRKDNCCRASMVDLGIERFSSLSMSSIRDCEKSHSPKRVVGKKKNRGGKLEGCSSPLVACDSVLTHGLD